MSTKRKLYDSVAAIAGIVTAIAMSVWIGDFYHISFTNNRTNCSTNATRKDLLHMDRHLNSIAHNSYYVKRYTYGIGVIIIAAIYVAFFLQPLKEKIFSKKERNNNCRENASSVHHDKGTPPEDTTDRGISPLTNVDFCVLFSAALPVLVLFANFPLYMWPSEIYIEKDANGQDVQIVVAPIQRGIAIGPCLSAAFLRSVQTS